MSLFKLKLSLEERLLVNILFEKNKDFCCVDDLKKINYDSLVRIASSHLMLPSLYINLKKKGIINSVPVKLKNYLKEIFVLNRKRNNNLLIEAHEISNELIKNKINHVFLKGSSHILNNIYCDIGERMIGDIDLLVSKHHLNKTIEILKKANYKEMKYSFFNTRHYPALLNSEKIFRVEVHYQLISSNPNKELLKPELILKNRIYTDKKIYKLRSNDELLYNIYNYQINDNGSCKLTYSYRSLYDTFMIIKNGKNNISDLKIDKYINKYLMIARLLNIPIFKLFKIKVVKLNLIRFRLKFYYKLYYVLDDLIIRLVSGFQTKVKQLVELFVNKKYRKYAIKKIFNKI